MHVQRESSQVRSQRKICSASSGSTNSTHCRGKSNSTSVTAQLYELGPAYLRGRPTLGCVAVLQVPDAKVALSTASVYPESTAIVFEAAGRLGYDGVEVMVWTDPVSQDIDALRRLSDYHGVEVLAIHAPCLIITQRVWGTDPWAQLVPPRAAAETLGASPVAVHPPFRWQREYARDFIGG